MDKLPSAGGTLDGWVMKFPVDKQLTSSCWLAAGTVVKLTAIFRDQSAKGWLQVSKEGKWEKGEGKG